MVLLIAGFATQPANADHFLSQVQQCTKHLPVIERMHNIPSNWLAAIASTESGRFHPDVKLAVPWPWTVNVQGKGFWFDSKQEAVEAVRSYQAKGIKSIDVGCMQVNLHYHGHAFANLNQAFDPAYNIAYAAKFLMSNYEKTKSWTDATAAYHSMTPALGGKYYRRVYKRWQEVVERLNDIAYSGVSVAAAEPFEEPSSMRAGVLTQTRNLSPYSRNQSNIQQTTRRQPVRLKAIKVADQSTGETRYGAFDMAYVPPEPERQQEEPETVNDLLDYEQGIMPPAKAKPASSFQQRVQKGVLVIHANADQQRTPSPTEELADSSALMNLAPAAGGAQLTAPKGQFQPSSATNNGGNYIKVQSRNYSGGSNIKTTRFVF